MADRAVGIHTALLHYFQKNPNRPITVDELIETFPHWDRRQLYSGVANLRKTSAGSAVEVTATGVWTYTDETVSGNQMLFNVLKAADDKLVLEDVNGDIWRAEFVG